MTRERTYIFHEWTMSEPQEDASKKITRKQNEEKICMMCSSGLLVVCFLFSLHVVLSSDTTIIYSLSKESSFYFVAASACASFFVPQT